MCSEALKTTSPPRPPSPPSGPPNSTSASRRMDMEPSPPLPERTMTSIWSINVFAFVPRIIPTPHPDRGFHKNKRGLEEPALVLHPMEDAVALLAEDRVLESLARDDLDDGLGLDLDRLAGRGIAAHARGALDELHPAEAGEHEALLFLLRTLDRESEEALVNGNRLLLADFASSGEVSHDSALGGRDDFFLSHFYDPLILSLVTHAGTIPLCLVNNIAVFSGACKGVLQKSSRSMGPERSGP